VSRQLAEEFERQARALLASHSALRHEWREERGERTLVFPADPEGFEVWVLVGEDNLVVGADSIHEHFEFDRRPPAAVAAAALELVRDLLGPAMRLRERSSNGRPYAWALERRRSGAWQRALGSTTAPFFNWFGRRTERVRQNHTLPVRGEEP
jgi:hypothetical protein